MIYVDDDDSSLSVADHMGVCPMMQFTICVN